jgi:hypothetical protein
MLSQFCSADDLAQLTAWKCFNCAEENLPNRSERSRQDEEMRRRLKAGGDSMLERRDDKPHWLHWRLDSRERRETAFTGHWW